jgi:hypothetical protein
VTTAELMLALVHLARADHQQALPLLQHALRAAQEAQHPWNDAFAHRLLGQVMIEQCKPVRALTHLGALRPEAAVHLAEWMAEVRPH